MIKRIVPVEGAKLSDHDLELCVPICLPGLVVWYGYLLAIFVL